MNTYIILLIKTNSNDNNIFLPSELPFPHYFPSVTVTLSAAWGLPQVRHEENPDAKLESPSKFHVDIYSHPKTTFSCEGRQAGEYYADPEAKCAIYFICLENVNGGLSAMSFACPNSTIFNQVSEFRELHCVTCDL
jgi:hypothetical protein